MNPQPIPASTVLAGIPAEEIGEWWRLLEPLIEKPLVRTGAIKDFHPSDIRKFLESRDMQCWIAHDGNTVNVCAITQILIYPRRKVLGVPFVGAERGTLATWIEHFETLKDFAQENQCSAIRVWGRKGWEKVLCPDVTRIECDIEV